MHGKQWTPLCHFLYLDRLWSSAPGVGTLLHETSPIADRRSRSEIENRHPKWLILISRPDRKIGIFLIRSWIDIQHSCRVSIGCTKHVYGNSCLMGKYARENWIARITQEGTCRINHFLGREACAHHAVYHADCCSGKLYGQT